MNKIRQWNYINRKRLNYYRKFQDEAEKILKREINKIENETLKGDITNRLSAILSESESEWTKYFSALSDTVIRAFLSVEKKADEEVIRNKISDYLKNYCGKQITGITETSRKLIMKTLADGVKQGLSGYQMKKFLEETVEPKYYNRALTISRTEVGRASNYGAIIGAEDDGMDTKEWVACIDNRCREAHAEADGQKVGINEYFVVGGESVFMPGDGSAENSINCRCCVNFHRLKERIQEV